MLIHVMLSKFGLITNLSQDEKLLASTREKKTKDNTLLSLQTQKVEAGNILASAEARRRGTKAEITRLLTDQVPQRTTVVPVTDPLTLVEGAVGGEEASHLPATVALGVDLRDNLRVTAASPTPVVVGTSIQETAGPGQSLSPLETQALVSLEMNRRAFRSAELRMRANDWRGSARLLATSDTSLDQFVCHPLFGSLPDSMRVELEKASLQNTLQRLMSCNKLGDWSGSNGLFDRATSFSNTIQATEKVRVIVLRARRCLFMEDYGECIRLCREGKSQENRVGSGNQSGYLDSILKNCLEAQRVGL